MKEIKDKDLNDLRNEIDAIDSQIAHLFKCRMKISTEVAKLKEKGGLPVYNERREEEILYRINEEIGQPYGRYGCMVFNAIFQVSRSCQDDYIKGINK